jgi:hypothetical protein
MRSRPRCVTAARRNSWRSILRKPLRRTTPPTRPRKFRPEPLAAHLTSPRKRSRRSASRITSWRAGAFRNPPSPPLPGNYSQSGKT